MWVGLLYLAYKARYGDAAAAELLTATQVVIRDVDGKSYWPVPDSPVPPSEPDPSNSPGMGVL
jgi:hypothetical protein